MKIGPQDPVADTPRPAAATGTPAPAQVVDKHSLAVAGAIAAAQAAVANVRVARVQQIAAAIKSGTYQPSAQEIANAILDAAMVDVDLEAGACLLYTSPSPRD